MPTIEYSETMEQWRDEIAPKATAMLKRVADACRAAGMHTGEAFDMCADDYQWALSVWPDPATKDDPERSVDVSISISEERSYEGGEGFGLNFSLDMVEYGGRILGGISPYNYTPDCWVDSRDADAVRERWELIESADLSEVPDLLNQ